MEKNKKILFIAYFFPPFEGIGSKRIAYWHEHIKQYNWQSLVITATDPLEPNEEVILVEAESKGGILNKIIKDVGINWMSSLKRSLKKYHAEEFDAILITGGPFMHMLLTRFLKSHFNAKIILDFRDPFYANPRFRTSFLKDQIKLFFQNRFLKHCDEVITVNNECAQLISHPQIHIINNGYDDKILNQIKANYAIAYDQASAIKACAIGRIDDDFDFSIFYQILKSRDDISFDYIGDNSLTLYLDKVNHYGKKSYRQALEFVGEHELCILFTSGLSFESSTKIFDYLALTKKLLIITQGQPKTGSMHEITQDYPNVYWAENKIESIGNAIDALRFQPIHQSNPYPFSRAAGLEKLINIIKI